MLPLLVIGWKEQRFGLVAGDIKETLLCPILTPPPVENSPLDGYFQYGEEWIPVLSAGSIIGSEKGKPGDYDVLILPKDRPFWALRVTSVEGVRKVSWGEVEPSSSLTPAIPGMAGVLQDEKGPLPVLVFSQLLLEQEKHLMQSVSQVLRKRAESASRAGPELESGAALE